MANISNVINVSVLPEGQLAPRDNMNVVAIISSEEPLSTAERYRQYRTAAEVAADFGTYSNTYAHASVFFSQQPNSVNAGGSLVIGYHRADSESVAATPVTLVGGQVDEAVVIAALQQISDGGMDLGVVGEVTNVDFSTVTTISNIVDLINTDITSDEVLSYADQRFTLVRGGTDSTVFALSAASSGTYIGEILKLGDDASQTPYTSATVLAAESKLEAVVAIHAQINFKGYAFISNTTDSDSQALAVWSQANSVLGYDVFDSETNLEVDATNPVWAIKLASQTAYRMLYSARGNRKLATAYMARMHTVNFNADNSATTAQMKTLTGIEAEDYSQTVIAKAATVGLDIYTTIKSIPAVLTSGANDFQDNVYNLIGFIDAVQTDMFNLLKGTATKIPQTSKGIAQMIDQGIKTSNGFVRAGVFAPGTWSSPDTFGDVDVFKRSISENGYYWLPGSLAAQPQAQRAARKSPVLQVAVKYSGAIHNTDIIINFNK